MANRLGSPNGMEQPRDVVFMLSTYPDARLAGQDYRAVKDLYYELNELARFDAVVVARQDKGELKLFKKPEFSTADAVWAGAGLGLAAGLATAVAPDIAAGTGLMAGAAAAAGLGAVATHVARGVGAVSLDEVSRRLHASASALVVATPGDFTDRVQAILTTADTVLTAPATIDTDHLTADARAAQQEARNGLDPRSAATLNGH